MCVVGIFSRGVALAQRIASKIYELEHEKIPCGALDITAYRDDRKPADTFDRTKIDFDVKNKNVVIVDDVFYTGRSTRAAIDALIERGRPKHSACRSRGQRTQRAADQTGLCRKKSAYLTGRKRKGIGK